MGNTINGEIDENTSAKNAIPLEASTDGRHAATLDDEFKGKLVHVCFNSANPFQTRIEGRPRAKR